MSQRPFDYSHIPHFNIQRLSSNTNNNTDKSPLLASHTLIMPATNANSNSSTTTSNNKKIKPNPYLPLLSLQAKTYQKAMLDLDNKFTLEACNELYDQLKPLAAKAGISNIDNYLTTTFKWTNYPHDKIVKQRLTMLSKASSSHQSPPKSRSKSRSRSRSRSKSRSRRRRRSRSRSRSRGRGRSHRSKSRSPSPHSSKKDTV